MKRLDALGPLFSTLSASYVIPQTKLRLEPAQRGLLRRGADLFFVFLDFHGFKVFCLENLTAIETFHVIDAVSTGDHLGTSVFTSGRHNKRLDEVYFTHVQALVKPPST